MIPQTVILAPHLDDAVFSCWHEFSQPGAVVVTICGGMPPQGTYTLWDRLCGTADGVSMMSKRLRENADALNLAGVTHLELNYLDQQYRSVPLTFTTVAKQLLKQFPDAKRFIAPLAMGRPYSHPDHVLVREVGKYLANKGRTVSFYADVPYMKTKLGPRKLKRLSKRATLMLGAPHTAQLIPLDPEAQTRKRQAMLRYSSQFRMTNLVAFGRLTSGRQLKQEITVVPKI